MSFLDNIRNKPPAQKMRIIWAIAGIIFILLIIIWVWAAKWQKNVPKDTSLFQTIGQGFHNIKENYRK